MTFACDEYGRRTLEFVSNVSRATSIDEVRRLTSEELAWYGLNFVTSWSIPSLDEEFSDTVTMNSRPTSYVDHYNETQLVARDPVVTTLRAEMTTWSWSEVRQKKTLSKPERFIIDEGREFGATDGLTIPVLSRNRWLGVFSPCGFKPDLSERARAALEVVGIYAHQALQRLCAKDARPVNATPLTPREREVMRWVALGKTNEEIGTILGVTRTTIKTMLVRAQEKLDASCRTYAVVQALRCGELDLNF